MFGWLFDRRMTGGVVFGPAAWRPGRIEITFETKNEVKEETHVRELPMERREAAAMLEDLGIGKTCGIQAGLPEQLRGLAETRGKVVILNLMPTQPEFLLGSAITRLAMEDVLAGLQEIRRIVKPGRVIVVMDRHDRETRRAWKSAVRGKSIEVRGLLNRYPQGHPVMLVRALFGKRLPTDVLPSRGGRIIVDAVACWGLGRWIRTGMPMNERPVQLFDEGNGNHGGAARLVMGRLGETITDMCGRFGLTVGPDKEIIENGMLAGESLDPATAMVKSSTESIAVRIKVTRDKATPCLACGWCVDVCPTGLVPVRLADLAKKLPPDVDKIRDSRLIGREVREAMHCIGCGLCSYVCPTRLPLAQETTRLRLRVLVAGGRGASAEGR